MNHRLFGAFVGIVIGLQSLALAADPSIGPTKEVLLPPQTGSNLPHRIRVRAGSRESGATAKKKKEEPKKRESKPKSAKASPTPEPKRRASEAESSPTPERFR